MKTTDIPYNHKNKSNAKNQIRNRGKDLHLSMPSSDTKSVICIRNICNFVKNL